MADVFSKQKRSEVMRSVRSSGNKSTEISLIKQFRLNRICGWRRRYKLFGNPDFVFPKARVVVFADGCYWHGHNCRNVKPASNREYWENKIKRNKSRDRIVSAFLRARDWRVIRIWECEINRDKKKINLLRTLTAAVV